MPPTVQLFRTCGIQMLDTRGLFLRFPQGGRKRSMACSQLVGVMLGTNGKIGSLIRRADTTRYVIIADIRNKPVNQLMRLQPSPTVQSLSRISSVASTTHSMAAFASFLVFLYNGRYRTLLDRLLRLRLAPPSSQVSREVSFEYLNRQLVCHAFTEFLLFLLPLVGISRWRRWVARAWRRTKSFMKSGGEEDEDGMKMGGELAFLPERTCAICYQDQNPISTSENEIMAATGASGGVIGSAQTDVTNPYETIPCGCIYCFVCLASRLEAEEGEGWICLRCGELVKECKPWSGDVLEDVGRAGSGSGKTVSFSDEEEKGQAVRGQHSIAEEEYQSGADATGFRSVDEESGQPPGEKGSESQEWAQVEAAGPSDPEEAHSA